MEELKPYLEYKDSGQSWLGRVPGHWTLPRSKLLYREVDERSATGEETLCSVSHKTGVTPRKANVTMFKAESTIGYKICRPDDLVINTLWAWMAALGIAREIGVVSPAYGVYRPRIGTALNSKYADQLLRTEQYKQEFIARSTGVNASRLRLYPEQFLQIPILLPPPDEQAAIVRFLSALDRRVNRFVRAKRRLIELLNEQKQAVLTHAVTRGLDPNVKLKPSGIDWLGDVPEHWTVERIKYLLREVDDRSLDGAEAHLSMSQRHGLIDSDSIGERRLFSDSYAGGKLCRTGDLVLNRLKAHLGVFAIAPKLGVISPDYTVLRPINDSDVGFLELVLRSNKCRPELRRRAKGIVQGFWRLYTDDLYAIRLPVPPPSEQRAIVSECLARTREIDTTIKLAFSEMDLFREYRTRLVADVVTGKLDVRAVAARISNNAETDSDEPESAVESYEDEETADDPVAEVMTAGEEG